MSEYSTSSPSIEQTRWYLIRPPSLTCTCRNETSCDSVAAYSFTGTLTSPKDTAPFQIARISYLRELVDFAPVSTSSGPNARAKGVTTRRARGPQRSRSASLRIVDSAREVTLTPSSPSSAGVAYDVRGSSFIDTACRRSACTTVTRPLAGRHGRGSG